MVMNSSVNSCRCSSIGATRVRFLVRLSSSLLLLLVFSLAAEDRLQLFYDRIKKSDVQYCPDKTRLLPDCSACIPGTREATGGSSCSAFIDSSADIRAEIKKLTQDRYKDILPNRPFGLYPCECVSML
jgi:hypothetical protein